MCRYTMCNASRPLSRGPVPCRAVSCRAIYLTLSPRLQVVLHLVMLCVESSAVTLHASPTTFHSSNATRRISHITHHTPPITHPPITYHVSHITCYIGSGREIQVNMNDATMRMFL